MLKFPLKWQCWVPPFEATTSHAFVHALRGAIRETWAKRLGGGCDGRCCLGKSTSLVNV